MRGEFAPVPVHGRCVRQLEVAGFRVAESTHRLPVALHAHRHPMIVLCVDGAFEETYTGSLAPVECDTHTVFVRPAAELHANRFNQSPARDVTIEVVDARIAEMCGQLLDRPRASRRPHWRVLARHLRQELRAVDAVAPLAAEGLILELVAALARWPDRASRHAAPRWLKDAHDILADSCAAEPQSVRTVAARVGVNPVHLARMFRRCFGESPGEFTRRTRVERAAARLREPRLTIAEVAHDAGFVDQSHFTRAFRRVFGTTPARWRRD